MAPGLLFLSQRHTDRPLVEGCMRSIPIRLFPFLVAALLAAAPVRAQYSDVPQPLPVPGTSSYSSAVQIGRRLYVSGDFARLATPRGAAVVVSATGAVQAGRFPFFIGAVRAIVRDGDGGWFVGGAFSSVDGRPVRHLAHVTADRRVDDRFRIASDGPIRELAVAHGRLYIVGDFTVVNGSPRPGFAALDLTTGGLSSWGAAFTPAGAPRDLSISSLGVYLASDADGGHVWGLDAASGRVLFDRRVSVLALAATSARVYVSGGRPGGPLWAIDPISGQDAAWNVALSFEYIPEKYYGGDATLVTQLLVADGRLYFSGRFRASGGRNILAAVDADTGEPAAWSPGLPPPPENYPPPAWLTRVGPAVLAGPLTFDAVTAAPMPFQPEVAGTIDVVAPAPEGAVVGGALSGVDGVARRGLAAIDLDTSAASSWESAWPGTPNTVVSNLATDGTWLFATATTYFEPSTRLAKLDPATGAVMAERELPGLFIGMAVAGDEIVVAKNPSATGGIAAELNIIRIDDWSIRAMPTTLEGELFDVAVAGDTIYLAGRFFRVNGVVLNSKTAAVHRTTGALLPWHTYADADVRSVATYAGRVFAGGDFRRIGGRQRRSLAELDPVTGAAMPWNPDVISAFPDPIVTIAPDGTLFASVGVAALAAGQPVRESTVAYSTSTGARLPWRSGLSRVIAATADCVLIDAYCLRAAISTPTGLRVTTSSGAVSLEWSLPPSPTRTGVRLEVGRTEGEADVITLDLAADRTTFSAPAPPGSYFARVRALAGTSTSLPTADVSFAVGPPDVPGAPLNFTAIMRPPLVTLAWTPPSTGAPPQYLLEAGSAPGQRDLGALPLPGSLTTFTIDPPDRRYWVRLVAVNASGRSAPSNDAYFDAFPFYTCGVLPPRNLAATVSGRTVTLTWDPPADGAEIVWLSVGSTPGTSDLGTIGMPPQATSYTVTAPPGTYYVRLFAPCVGETSNEVRVVVP